MKFINSTVLICMLLITCIGSISTSYSQTYQNETRYFNHLLEINKEWANYPNACPNTTISFKTDAERIQTHLDLVIKYLRINSPEHLKAKQHASRQALLDSLTIYASSNTYPMNTEHLLRTPYFVDNNGVHCAVGQLMHVSGHDDLVASIQKEFNYNYIADIRTKGVLEWSREHGFTIDELKWIQPGYAPNTLLTELENGVNGSIKQVLKDQSNDRLIIAGTFDSINQLPCLSVGEYKNGQLNCLGNGINGIIRDVQLTANSVLVFGEFYSDTIVYPIAEFDGVDWTYINPPYFISSGARSGISFGNNLEVSLYPYGSSENDVICRYNFTDNVWSILAETNGVVLDISLTNAGRAYAGHFDSIITYENNQIDSTLSASNVVMREYLSGNWLGLSGDICDTVNVITHIGSAIYFGGSCSVSGSQVCMTRYLNSALQPLLTTSSFSPNSNALSINDFIFNNQSEMLVVGNFEVPGMYYGNNFGKYDLVYNVIRPLALLDKPVSSIAIFEDEIFIGGNFTTSLGSPVKYLARTNGTIGLNESKIVNTFTAYPNPFTNEIILENIENGTSFTLTNSLGQIVKSGIINNQKIDNLERLVGGTYVLQLTSSEGVLSQTIIK